MSFEISNDNRSERLRDHVSKALVEAIGDELQYGRWTVRLRADTETVSVVMTGPGVREEWSFSPPDTHDAADFADRLRQRFQRARHALTHDP